MITQEQIVELRASVAHDKKNAKTGAVKIIQKFLKISHDAAWEVSKAMRKNENITPEEIETIIASIKMPSVADIAHDNEISRLEQTEDIVSCGNHFVNKLTDEYITPLKTAGINVVLNRYQHEGLLAAYSNTTGKPVSMTNLAEMYGMTEPQLKEYLGVHNFKRSDVPVTDEEVAEGDVEKTEQRLYSASKLKFLQDLQTKKWQRIQKLADTWTAFEAGKINPFKEMLDNYKPADLKPLPHVPSLAKSDSVFLVGLSDIHFGAKANADELTGGLGFSTERALEIVDDFANQIKKDTVQMFGSKFQKCVIAILGDILHSPTGFTVKGTMLATDQLGRDQVTTAVKSLEAFIQRMYEIFGEVEVHAVQGNHSGTWEWAMLEMLKKEFKGNNKVKFNIYNQRTGVFRILDTMVLIDHGDSDYIKAKIPTNDTARRSWIAAAKDQALKNDNSLVTCNHTIVLQGDLHHFEHSEYSNGEFFIFSTAVTGDKYADHLNLHNRARQNALVISPEGAIITRHYFFDE